MFFELEYHAIAHDDFKVSKCVNPRLCLVERLICARSDPLPPNSTANGQGDFRFSKKLHESQKKATRFVRWSVQRGEGGNCVVRIRFDNQVFELCSGD